MDPYKINVNVPKLSAILGAVSSFTGYEIRFYSSGNQQWMGNAARNLPLCRLMERNPKTNERCIKCDNNANQRCQKATGTFSYTCHASLLEVVCPVYYEDIYAGYLNIGQFRVKDKAYDDSYFEDLAACSGFDQAILKKKLAAHPLLSKKNLSGAYLLEEMCADRLIQAGVFSMEHNATISEIERYVKENLAQPLTLKEIAARIYVNPTYLSALYHKVTGVTLFQYIQTRRIEQACYLIRTTNLSFTRIAAIVGYPNPNYFTKVFKKEHGMTPREYHRRWNTGEIIV